jgi:hypothetical protein
LQSTLKNNIMTITEIVTFRKNGNHKSTTHYMTIPEYQNMAIELVVTFYEFNVQMRPKNILPFEYRTGNYPNQMVELTILK